MSAWIPARWRSPDPRSIELLTGTPINCIVLDARNWPVALIEKARSKAMAVYGVLRPARADDEAHTALRLGLNGVLLENDYGPDVAVHVRAALQGSACDLVELPLRDRINLDSTSIILGTAQALWPGIQIEHGGKRMTGPSSAPWIDTNTGFLKFLRAGTDASLWVATSPPRNTIITPQRYGIAIADCAIMGARWILDLDEDLERRLFRRDARAMQDWNAITTFLRYYAAHPAWEAYRSFSRFAVVQDKTTGGMLSACLLDMLSVLHTPVRSIPVNRLSAETLSGVRIVLNVNHDAQHNPALQRFADAGATVLSPPANWHFPPVKDTQITPDRPQIDAIQKMWEMVYNATARKNFGARTFNTSSILTNVLASPNEKSLLVHLINYADLEAESVTVHALGEWKTARLYTPDNPVQDLSVYAASSGTGVDIDTLHTLGTVRFDR